MPLVAAKAQLKKVDDELKFDYTVLAEDIQDEAAENALAIRDKVQDASDKVASAGQDLYDAGLLLVKQKELLGHSHWLPWIDQELGFSERRAQLLMSIPQRWPNRDEYAPISMLSQSIQQLLAAPSTPEAAIKQIVDMQAAGDEPTVKEVKAIITTHRPAATTTKVIETVAPPPPNYVSGKARALSLDETIAVLRQGVAHVETARAAAYLRRSKPVAYTQFVPSGAVLDGFIFESAVTALAAEFELVAKAERDAITEAAPSKAVYTGKAEDEFEILAVRVSSAISAMLAKATVSNDIETLANCGVLTEEQLNRWHEALATLREIAEIVE